MSCPPKVPVLPAGLTLSPTGRVSGPTYPHREFLKTNGFRWNPSEKVWYIAMPAAPAVRPQRPLTPVRKRSAAPAAAPVTVRRPLTPVRKRAAPAPVPVPVRRTPRLPSAVLAHVAAFLESPLALCSMYSAPETETVKEFGALGPVLAARSLVIPHSLLHVRAFYLWLTQQKGLRREVSTYKGAESVYYALPDRGSISLALSTHGSVSRYAFSFPRPWEFRGNEVTLGCGEGTLCFATNERFPGETWRQIPKESLNSRGIPGRFSLEDQQVTYLLTPGSRRYIETWDFSGAPPPPVFMLDEFEALADSIYDAGETLPIVERPRCPCGCRAAPGFRFCEAHRSLSVDVLQRVRAELARRLAEPGTKRMCVLCRRTLHPIGALRKNGSTPERDARCFHLCCEVEEAHEAESLGSASA